MAKDEKADEDTLSHEGYGYARKHLYVSAFSKESVKGLQHSQGGKEGKVGRKLTNGRGGRGEGSPSYSLVSLDKIASLDCARGRSQ